MIILLFALIIGAALLALGYKIQQTLLAQFSEHRIHVQQHGHNQFKQVEDSLRQGRMETHQVLKEALQSLTQTTEQRLKDISHQVDKRLNEGFEKTTATFTDIVKRLALIDEAQKKMAELSTQVINLQTLLADKRSRGTFGEVQLNALIRNVLPEQHFSLQHRLSNDKRVDCMLFLPEPTGNLIIDAKFPLENYKRLSTEGVTEPERKLFEQQFRVDIKYHIQTIAEKYIIPGETADGAIMFIPAEAIFSDIHAHYPDLVEFSQKMHVWLVSPTTLMAILTTARAVLKDDATRKQIHIIQEHLQYLSKDFERFQKRMDDLQKHIELAHKDVDEVNTSARKITNRFNKIEKAELTLTPENLLE